MFFDDEDRRFYNADLMNVVRRELFAINSNLEVTPFGLRSAPTHTEDGIPIRKLYVSNLPPKTTRMELFGVFVQYGFIKNCWVRMGDKGPNRPQTPAYAFVTFTNPADAHKALQAPNHEKMLRGRYLKISPADSWHQPSEDADGRVRWKPHGQRRSDTRSRERQDAHAVSLSPDSDDAAVNPEIIALSDNEEEDTDGEPSNSILDVLNTDCMSHILSYVPIRDLIRSERVSKRWQNMIQEYLESIRIFKTSWWQHGTVTLTTAVLRRVLQRLGATLTRLHIDHHWSALNDRTAHTVGKFCPALEELKVVGMHTKNWNPLIYGCKELRTLSFVSCSKLTDASLVHLLINGEYIDSLTVANNTHVTGLFLTGSTSSSLRKLAFYNCYSLQGTVLSAAIDTLPLTTLKLDVCPVSMWKIIPLILKKLPDLEELSLSEYSSVELCLTPQSNDEFIESIATLTKLKVLNLSRNIYITNAVLKQVAQSCPKLESLNISSCNSRRTFPNPGVGDEGVSAVCGACPALRSLDVSYLAALTDAGAAAAARCPALATLTARGHAALTAAPFAQCLHACHHLEEIDLCGCDVVSEEVIFEAVRALDERPRPLTLRLAGTSAAMLEDFPTHKMLTLNIHEDLCNPHLRPDFVDRIFEDSSDDSLDDFYEHDNFDDFFGSDNEIFMDDELDEYDEAIYGFGIHGHDIILL